MQPLPQGTDARPTDSATPTGRHIGPYRLLGRLGRGGMGVVYKAEHVLLKRAVALKLTPRLRPGSRRDEVLSRFRREVEAAARLHHPGIVTAYDAGAAGGRLYLAMEYVQGVDLERLVRRTGPLSVDLACEVVRQAAEALQHAHERGLTHRDIKPSNLMLASPGVAVKLLDFGLARLALHGETADAETVCGTPDFMPPETGADSWKVDVRGDLYSLGCTFYFLLTGTVPYPGGNWTEKLLRHGLDVPPPLAELRPDVPAEVVTVVERLMARDPQDRHPTAAALADELAVLGSAGTASRGEAERPDDIPARRRRFSPPFSLASLVAILLGVVAAGGARWFVSPSVPNKPSQQSPGVPFQIEGRPDLFPTLAQAVASARDGDVITVEDVGPFRTSPLSWRGKALTIRAGQNVRPRLEATGGNDPWAALLDTDRTLCLQGIDLAVAEGREESTAFPLVRCEGADLRLTDCHLRTRPAGVAVSARRCGTVEVRGCRIDAGAVALSMEAGEGGGCRIRLVDSRLTVRDPSGAVLSLWAAEGTTAGPAAVELGGNTLRAGRITALRSFNPPVTITARDNRFIYRSAVLCYTGYPGRDPWRGTTWQGDGNTYEGSSTWLWVEGRAVDAAELRTSGRD